MLYFFFEVIGVVFDSFSVGGCWRGEGGGGIILVIERFIVFVIRM